jgi:hypothetical protein
MVCIFLYTVSYDLCRTLIYLYATLTSCSALNASRDVESNWRYLKVIGVEWQRFLSFHIPLCEIMSLFLVLDEFFPLVTSLSSLKSVLMAVIIPLLQYR